MSTGNRSYTDSLTEYHNRHVFLRHRSCTAWLLFQNKYSIQSHPSITYRALKWCNLLSNAYSFYILLLLLNLYFIISSVSILPRDFVLHVYGLLAYFCALTKCCITWNLYHLPLSIMQKHWSFANPILHANLFNCAYCVIAISLQVLYNV